MELISKSFKVFNTDQTKNRKVTCFTLLELKFNRYTENIDITVTYFSDITG